MLKCICTLTCSSFCHCTCTKMLTFYMDIYVNHLQFPFALTFPAKTLWVPAHCKIFSEIFVGARAPRTRPSAPHVCRYQNWCFSGLEPMQKEFRARHVINIIVQRASVARQYWFRYTKFCLSIKTILIIPDCTELITVKLVKFNTLI